MHPTNGRDATLCAEKVNMENHMLNFKEEYKGNCKTKEVTETHDDDTDECNKFKRRAASTS